MKFENKSIINSLSHIFWHLFKFVNNVSECINKHYKKITIFLKKVDLDWANKKCLTSKIQNSK